jgi:hypothetical protein
MLVFPEFQEFVESHASINFTVDRPFVVALVDKDTSELLL